MKTKEELKEEIIRDGVLEYLSDKKIVEFEDNVIYMPKAFKCNSIIRWCIKRKLKKTMTDAGVAKYYRVMDRFIEGEIDLLWNKKGYWTAQQKSSKSTAKSNKK